MENLTTTPPGNIFLLVGPSGAGKSTSAKIIANSSDIKVYDLDGELRSRINGNSLSNHFSAVGNEKFFLFSKQTIAELTPIDSSSVLIVVGAGSIDFKASHSWYSRQNLIALTGEPGIIYERGNRSQFHSSLEGYRKSEFSKERETLYSSAKFIIDVTTLNPQDVSTIIIEYIKQFEV